MDRYGYDPDNGDGGSNDCAFTSMMELWTEQHIIMIHSHLHWMTDASNSTDNNILMRLN